MKIIFLLLITVLVSEFSASENLSLDWQEGFPKEWWTPVDPSSAPDWEILPQAAEKDEVILSKRTELGILSNFAATPFLLDNRTYASVEGFWQMMKFPEDAHDPRTQDPSLDWPHTREEISQMTGFEAKRAGKVGSLNMKKMGINWVTYRKQKLTYRTQKKGEHYRLIERAMRAKLEQNPQVKKVLLKTKDLTLKPDHKQGADTPPAWMYYRIWEKLRAELMAGSL
jgi:predicted NAD-dependent protein-ADP-ribosyltransferase YbiA (DUF1768 family)